MNSENSDSLLIIAEMLFIDYQSFVLEEYKRKEAAGDLSHRIRDLTRSKLKEECIAVCRGRYDRKDEKTLQAFFDYHGSDKEACLQAIGKFDIDKFRPLVNFLKGSINKPDPKTIELLAWLIDFSPRPLEVAKKNGIKNPDNPDSKPGKPDEPPNNDDEGSAPTVASNTISASRARIANLMIATIMLLMATIGLYLLWPRKVFVPTGPQGCMYWEVDHYQPVSCSQKLEGVLVIALDSEKIRGFRKITRTDTVTESSVGKLWYVKYNGSYELYTAEGFHPIDPLLRLRPLSKFILFSHFHLNR